MDYGLGTIKDQVADAQKKVADIEIMMLRTLPHHDMVGCSSCQSLIEDVKIILDGVFINLEDYGLTEYTVYLESFRIKAESLGEATELANQHLSDGGEPTIAHVQESEPDE